nr:MAG TPA: hypothetical protein [Caudoviricetes sp.]
MKLISFFVIIFKQMRTLKTFYLYIIRIKTYFYNLNLFNKYFFIKHANFLNITFYLVQLVHILL